MKISRSAKCLITSMAIAVASVFAVVAPASAIFYCPDGTESSDGTLAGCSEEQGGSKNAQDTDLMGTLNTIVNVAIGVIGFLAVVMIIVGGVQYTTSAGDAAKVTKAKNTIMYGVIGLVVALLAYAIVNFVLANVFHKS